MKYNFYLLYIKFGQMIGLKLKYLRRGESHQQHLNRLNKKQKQKFRGKYHVTGAVNTRAK